MKKNFAKNILKISGRTVICYLLSSLACLLTTILGLFLTNFTEGWSTQARQLFAQIFGIIPGFFVCWKLSLADGYNLCSKKEFTLKRYLIGNLISVTAWTVFAFFLSLLYARISEIPNAGDLSSVPYYLLYFCMLPITLLWWADVPLFVLWGTLITIVPFTFLRIFAATQGDRRYKIRFPSESGEEDGTDLTEKKRHWKDSLRQDN